ncbi:SDR family oxidoreductase [Phycicoccus endophyticus]|uniref:SDR family oxidoreductase n=1 Tax=Phycicoccus endophyticus TaxID=1690220 RepID=A0A7G9R1J7_9MICO|nr:SDR family oxidoreductase [Phycicoccus endophyticus]NHI18738.1 SDR family oxidoreductase [Phycicoccus endophyticus]QNN49472.1 SDR family oxidoreductase [Phycicoccus endophyticus]GGL36887.1 oxidoreductase [Phycicoccus endophyticus]
MPAPARDLTDTVLVVTGAGGGIGGATVGLALEAGARVVAGDLREDAVDRLVEEWGPARIVPVVGDVREEATAERLVAAGVEAYGRVDSVVANAAVGFYGGLLDYSSEQVELMVDVTVKGTVWLARAAVRQFRAQGDGGDIVIIGSVAGLLIGGGREAVYAATKGAQVNLGYALDRELRGEGIRTTVIAPAGVNTPFAAADGRFGEEDPSCGPFMEPADIGGAIVHTLQQPRRMRTELWTMWSLAEAH